VYNSFQSTSSCNISTVNALSTSNKLIQRCEHGLGDNKRYWSIKINHAWTLYLGSYYRIGCIDHLIQNSPIFYGGWKFWHSPVIHGKGLAVVALSAAKVNSMLNGKLKSRLTSCISVRSFQSKCLGTGISQPIKCVPRGAKYVTLH
jgi:hypothetical protein